MEEYVDFKSGSKKNATDPMDYDQYYPVALPLRKPRSGLAEVLDEEEFGGSQEYDEDAVPAAKELGLFRIFIEESLEDKFMFFQLPSALPMDMVPEVPKDEGSSNPAQKAAGSTKESISLDKLPEGFLGKMLVYESGAVKFQLGDVIFDAMPGTSCVFAQELAAINPVAKHCLFLGDIRQRVVLTPDIDRLLDKNSENS